MQEKVLFFKGETIPDQSTLETGGLYFNTANNTIYMNDNDKIIEYGSTKTVDTSKMLEGFSSKYNITKKGWHRVLNTIRGNGGTLSLTLTDGLQLESLKIDMSGFVRWSDSGNPQIPDFIQSSYKHLKPSSTYSDDFFLHKITKVRIGYPSQEAIKTKFEEVGPNNPINCYVDIYVDFNRNNSKAFTCQFTGKSNQHNCYNITQATNDSNYETLVRNHWNAQPDGKPEAAGTPTSLAQGMYGEELEFYSTTINPTWEEYAPNKTVINKSIYADEFLIKSDTYYRDINVPHCIGKYPVRVHTWLPDHGVTSSSNCNFRFVRKYNWLNLHVPMDVDPETGKITYNHYDYTYGDDTRNGDNGQTTERVIVPNQCSRKTFYGLYYNITNSGAFIFNGNATSATTIDVFCAKTKEDAIFLPAGNYLVGSLYSIAYQEVNSSTFSDIDSAITKPIGHFIGLEDGKRKVIITLDTDCYLVRAKMRATVAVDSGDDCIVEIPFLVKLPAGCPTDNVDIIDYNFAPATNHKITGLNYGNSNDNNGRFIYTGADDKIIITDNTSGTTVTEIDLWTNFYSSEYAKGTKIPYENPIHDHENFDTGLQELSEVPSNWQSQTWEAMGTYTPIVDVYRMYNNSTCDNYYDTLLMPDSNGMIENINYTSVGSSGISAHTHSASDITSGTISYARIPVGTTSTTVAQGNHTHSGYASSSHTHSNYMTESQVRALVESMLTASTTTSLTHHVESGRCYCSTCDSFFNESYANQHSGHDYVSTSNGYYTCNSCGHVVHACSSACGDGEKCTDENDLLNKKCPYCNRIVTTIA